MDLQREPRENETASIATYIALSCISGAAWGLVVAVVVLEGIPRAIWGGLLASPVIGLLIGAATVRWCRLGTLLRIGASLVSLYVGAALFGLAVGVYDWLTVEIPNRIPYATVLEAVFAFLWGLTVTGYVAVFWPLAYVNHWLLSRVRRHASHQPR